MVEQQSYGYLSNVNSIGPTKIPIRDNAPFNTLAQLGTNHPEQDNESAVVLAPITRKDNTRTLEKRAKSKYFSHSLAVQLLKASKGRGVLSNAYRRTLECSGEIVVGTDGRAVAHYCKNRWCTVCSRIRTAVTMKKYGPVLESWLDAYFVTLTVRNVTGNELPMTVKAMTTTFQRIAGRFKKRAQRGQASAFVGLRKFECTVNAGRDDYHPHFHAIVRGQANANALRRAWLNEFSGHAGAVAQDVRKADTGSIKELLKYASKLVVKIEGRGKRGVYADMQNVVFESIKGTRTLQSFGFKLPKVEDSELRETGNSQLQGIVPDSYFVYEHGPGQWANVETGEFMLPDFIMPESIRELSENIIVRPEYRRNGNRAYKVPGAESKPN